MTRPITTINPELGDASFVAAFGRPPTEEDDPTVRVATHLRHVATLLRARGRSGAVMDALDAYIAAEAFPASEAPWGLLPSFVDPHTGTRCAVAHLVETTAGTALVEALDRDHHHAYIATFAEDPRFVAWAESSGLTLEELAWIQPSYPYEPPPPNVPDLTFAIAAEVATAPSEAAAMPHGFSLAHAGVTYRTDHDDAFYNVGVLALDGAVGASAGDHSLAFSVHARAGQELRFWGHDDTSGEIAGWTIGAGADRFGDGLAAAWTMPVTGYWTAFATTSLRTGLHASVVLAPGGFGLADRTWLAGSAGLEATFRTIGSRFGVSVSVDASWIGESSFVGVTLGAVFAAPPAPEAYAVD